MKKKSAAKRIAGDLKRNNRTGPGRRARRPERSQHVDTIRPRNIGHSLARLKGGEGPWERGQHKRGETIAVSFTITPEVDRMIHDLALKMGRSRSAVVRQMTLHYATCEKVLRGLQGD